jgi:hypothetical protein
LKDPVLDRGVVERLKEQDGTRGVIDLDPRAVQSSLSKAPGNETVLLRLASGKFLVAMRSQAASRDADR